VSNQNERYSKEYVSTLETRLAEAERERDEAVEETIYTAITDDGRVVYEGTRRAAAITDGCNHWRRTGEHVAVPAADWDTRRFGGPRKLKRPSG
jgi:hypothetical protein